MVIAGIFEFAGAFLMGSSVTSTIQSKICDPMAFQEDPEMLMFGMLCVIVGVAAWLIIATMYSLPVSTTHSCIGGLVGMTIVAKGAHAVKWASVGGVVASWFVSPVLSGLITCLLFWIVRKYVLRAKDSFNRAFHFYPLLIGFTLFVLSLFMLLKGIPGLSSTLNPWLATLISLVFGGMCALILTFTVVPCLKKRIEAQRRADQEAVKAESGPVVIDVVKKEVELPVISNKPAEKPAEEKPVEKKEVTVETPKEKNTMLHQNIHAELADEKSVVYQLHQRAEKFDPYTERVFSYLQVITATLNAFAHGANDVANSIGPLASIVAIYKSGAVSKSPDVEPWILVLGGAGHRGGSGVSGLQGDGGHRCEHGDRHLLARLRHRGGQRLRDRGGLAAGSAAVHYPLPGGFDGGRGSDGGQELRELEAGVAGVLRVGDYPARVLCHDRSSVRFCGVRSLQEFLV